MILEEIIGLAVSLVAVFTSQTPQTSHRNPQREFGSIFDEHQEREAPWVDTIHREYEREDGNELQQQTDYYTSVSYLSVGSESRINPSFWQSLQRSLRANVGIIMAVIPLGLLSTAVVYFEMNTSNLCLIWEKHNNSISNSVMRWKLIGENIEAIPVNIWLPMTLVLLFGWKEFKSNYISTLYIGFAVEAVVVIYRTFLFLFGVFRTHLYYRYPENVVYIVAMIISSILVARTFRREHPLTAYSNFHITFMISFGFVAAFSLTMVYQYFILPYFNKVEDHIHKALIAAIAPVVVLIPTAICKYLALRQGSEIISPDRSFVLAYFLRGGAITLYRIMQAGFNSISLFVGLSLLHGLSNVFSKATDGLRGKVWTRLIECLRRTSCGRRVELLSLNTPHQRRLTADIEIQNILFEYNTLTLSQVYLVLYPITSFTVSPWHVIRGSLIRMAIGLGIDFVFNCISVFIQIHYYDVPMRRVWLKHWKRHVIANAINLIVMVFYFSIVILTVFETTADESSVVYVLKNCTLPFRSF